MQREQASGATTLGYGDRVDAVGALYTWGCGRAFEDAL